MQTQYLDGRADGDFVQYGERKRAIVEGHFLEGKKDKRWFYKLNDIRAIEFYAQGERHGTFTLIGRRNAPLYEGTFENDKATGLHSYYNADGSLFKTETLRRWIQTRE